MGDLDSPGIRDSVVAHRIPNQDEPREGESVLLADHRQTARIESAVEEGIDAVDGRIEFDEDGSMEVKKREGYL